MSGPTLASDIKSAMSFSGSVSTQLTGWATAFVSEIQSNAIVNHALVTATTAPGSPIPDGAATLGVISGLDGSRLANAVAAAAGYGSVTSELSAFCSQIVTHIMTATVTFAPGTITGDSTSSPISPGPLVNGAGTGGTIVGLSGSALASLIHSAVGYPGGVSTPLIQFCTALMDHVTNNAAAAYASGSVTGTCPPGGGPLAGGIGVNGTIS